ncbi:MAG: hypothetical protein FJX35_27970 [Alphaproteobacteria bacterium]|nr:hypothetical protein [Alphaproteobacteria bacterium]
MSIASSKFKLSPGLALGALFALFQALIWLRTGYYPAAASGDDLWFSESAYYLLHDGALRRPMHDDDLGSLTYDFLPPLSNLVQAGVFMIFGVTQFAMLAQSSLWCTLISALVFVMARVHGADGVDAFLASMAIYGSQIVLDVLIHVRFEQIQFFFFLVFMACDFAEKTSQPSNRAMLAYRFTEGLALGAACIAYYPMAPFVLLAGLFNYYPDKLKMDRNLAATILGGAVVGGLFLAYVAHCVTCFFYQVIVTGVSEYLALQNLWFIFVEIPGTLFGVLSVIELFMLMGMCVFYVLQPAKRNFGMMLAVLTVPVFVYARPSQAALPIILCLIDMASADFKERTRLFRFFVGVMAVIGLGKVSLVAATAYIQREGRDYRHVERALAGLRIGPDDLVATTGQAWLALRPRLAHDQLHHLIDAEVPDAHISSSKILFSDELETKLRYVIVLNGMIDVVRASYPVLDRMFVSGRLRRAFEVRPPFQDLPWAQTSPYHLIVYEAVRP